jgi:Uma2 family endonuclease
MTETVDSLSAWGGVSDATIIRRQSIGTFLGNLVAGYVKFHALGTVYQPPFQITLLNSDRESVLVFISKTNPGQLRNSSFNGTFDLVIDFAGSESVTDELARYADESGPKEYWLLDPDQHQATFYQLDPGGEYQAVPLDAQGKYFSQALPGFWFQPDWLWQAPLPELQWALLLVGGAR